MNEMTSDFRNEKGVADKSLRFTHLGYHTYTSVHETKHYERHLLVRKLGKR